jgi:hypothetical protein
MSTSLEERLYAREFRALYRANRHSPEPFSGAQSEAFQREARRRARLRAQYPRELRRDADALAEHQITRDDPLPSPRPDLIPSVLRSEPEWEVDRAF